MTAGTYQLTIEKGATLSRAFTCTDESGALVLLASCTARMKVRPTKDSTTVYISLTTGAGITLADTAPNLIISMSATDTAALTWAEGDPAKYDLEIVSGGVVTRLLEGNCFLSHEVTY